MNFEESLEGVRDGLEELEKARDCAAEVSDNLKENHSVRCGDCAKADSVQDALDDVVEAATEVLERFAWVLEGDDMNFDVEGGE